MKKTRLPHVLLLALVMFGPGRGIGASEPSNDNERAKAKDELGYSREADSARKAKMSPAELAWEKILETNLGNFYLPRYKKEKEEGKVTAWDYVEDVPGLPRVLIIGDSISRAYTLIVRRELKGLANVHRAPENCGGTVNGLKKLPVYLDDGNWDLITFNFGIHDRTMKANAYADNLSKIAAQLKETGVITIWVNSTPLCDKGSKVITGKMMEINKAAAAIMEKHGFPSIDLYAAAKPIVPTLQNDDGCHYKEEGNEILGKAVAEGIRKVLKSSLPAPAVDKKN